MSQTAKEREVLQLLKDYRPFWSAFGGAMPLEDSHLRSASYGPAGLIQAGTIFDKEDRRLLAESLADLWGALARLQWEKSVGKYGDGETITGSAAYNSLIQPYLGDPADASMIGDMRRKVAELDRENERRAKEKPPKAPRVALVFGRRQLEAHDAAVKWLAEDLRDVELYAIFARPWTEKEEAENENKNAEMYAVFQRLRVSGLTEEVAVVEAAKKCDVPPSVVERVIEFRSEMKPDECTWGGCERAPFSQNLCVAHYHKQRRAEKKGRTA